MANVFSEATITDLSAESASNVASLFNLSMSVEVDIKIEVKTLACQVSRRKLCQQPKKPSIDWMFKLSGRRQTFFRTHKGWWIIFGRRLWHRGNFFMLEEKCFLRPPQKILSSPKQRPKQLLPANQGDNKRKGKIPVELKVVTLTFWHFVLSVCSVVVFQKTHNCDPLVFNINLCLNPGISTNFYHQRATIKSWYYQVKKHYQVGHTANILCTTDIKNPMFWPKEETFEPSQTFSDKYTILPFNTVSEVKENPISAFIIQKQIFGNFCQTAYFLHQLRRKENCQLRAKSNNLFRKSESQKAFEVLTTKLTTTPASSLLSMGELINKYTDASQHAMSAILTHVQKGWRSDIFVTHPKPSPKLRASSLLWIVKFWLLYTTFQALTAN